MRRNIWKDRRIWTIAACVLVIIGAVVSERGLEAREQAMMAAAAQGSAVKEYRGGSRKQPYATILCNVYSGPDALAAILDTLEAKGVRASFFFGGAFVPGNETLLKRAALSGQEIANHGNQHRMHSQLGIADNEREILTAETRIEKACGVKTELFAPPSGDYNAVTVQVAAALGYRTVLWTHDTIDWRDQDAALIAKRATKDPTNGMMILIHPTAATAQALPHIIDTLQAQGFRFVTASESLDALDRENEAGETGSVQFHP